MDSKKFNPHFHILRPAQLEIYPILYKLTNLKFVLYGGTAIALMYGHRESLDFDFFTNQYVDEDFKSQILNCDKKFKKSTIIQNQFNTLSIMVDDKVKISLFGGIGFGRVGEPLATADLVLNIASPYDLLATKLAVILQRAEYKDYIDISELIINGNDLSLGIGAAMSLYKNMYHPIDGLKALTFFSDGNLNKLSEKYTSLLVNSVKNVDLFNLPIIDIISYDLFSNQTKDMDNKPNTTAAPK
jgi:hypothetical protein